MSTTHCLSCGLPVARPDQQFCAGCGASTVAVEPPPAYGQATRITGPLFADDVRAPLPASPAPAPAPYEETRTPRRRRPVVLLVAAAVLAALIGAGGVLLLFGSDDAATGPSGPGTHSRDDSGRSGSGATPSTGATASGSATATGSETSAAFRCWDGGSPVTRLRDCTDPTGVEGMSWVFPSSAGSTCAPTTATGRVSEVECTPVVDGAPVLFHYSEWHTRPDLEIYYGRNMVSATEPPQGRDDLEALRVESRDPDVGFKVAVFYADLTGLWSVTIYAADQAQYVAALAELEIRPFRQLRGAPAP